MYLTDVVTLPRFCFGRGVYKRFPELCGNLGARFALVGGRTAMEKGLPALKAGLESGAMQMLCAHFQGTYPDAIDFGCQLRLAHPELPLSDDALHFNIVDQFIETAQENYITEIQIPILSA